MRFLYATLLILLGMLLFRLFQGENGLREYFSLQKQIEVQRQSNDKLRARNQVLKEEIADLRGGTEAIEERARNELGLVKDGETFYRVVTGKKKHHFTDSE